MTRLVVDNMIINYLVEPPGPPMPDYSGLADLLKEEVRSRTIEVAGSFPLMEEITGAYKCFPEKFRAMWSLCDKILPPRILKPGNNRAEEELEKGRPLTESESLLHPGARAYFHRQAAKEQWVEEMAEKVDAFKRSFESWWQSISSTVADKVQEELADATSPGHLKARAVSQFFKRLPSHIQFFFERQWERRHGDSGPSPEVRKFPCFYAVHLFMYTKILKFLEQGKKFRKGDGHDLLYFIDAWTAADYLVTEDTGIIAACDQIGQIEVIPFKILQSAEFAALLRR